VCQPWSRVEVLRDGEDDPGSVSTSAADPSLEALLQFLEQARGIDFTGYKRASLERRFRRRLEIVGCATFDAYIEFLELHPEEFDALFDTLLINVTEFFRDMAVWVYLQQEVLPALLESKDPAEPIRVWSAGCASGQEAYTAAIVFAEALGPQAFGERVKIYATDIDQQALDVARHGTYTAKELEGVPPDLREKYFERTDRKLAFRKGLRRSVIFGVNNLVSDAPISRLDLLICRNTLMYFTPETQSRILGHFHFALRDHGVLVLGKSEMMVSHRDLFTATDLKKRVFSRNGRQRAARMGMAAPVEDGRLVESGGTLEAPLTRDLALDAGPVAQIVVSSAGLLDYANLPARSLFGLRVEDLGRPFHELELSYRPFELRQPIEQVLRERRSVALGEVHLVPEAGEERYLDVTVAPLLSAAGPALGASVLFEDVTRLSSLQHEVEGHRRELEQAYEELQSTIDELETTNEELQSANEELQTTNEELQSSNEELETMNEELQSTNEELETINDELRDRTGELNELNDFLEAILTSLATGIAVLDLGQKVVVWNQRAEDLWGVRRDEALQAHFLSLDLGLPTDRLAPALRAVLGGASGRERLRLDAIDRRGRTIVCLTSVLPLIKPARDGGGIRGALVLMEDELDGDGSRPATVAAPA
jgi:two-component system CheB/CheR fusion protein